MGYYVESTEVNMTIDGSKISNARKKINDWILKDYDSYTTMFRSTPYVDNNDIVRLLIDAGFDCAEDVAGNIVIQNFDGKWREHDRFMDCFKDSVSDDAFISFVGEDAAMWRWTPRGIKTAKITWE
jgi:hypothetical protein